ncbi:hypothetical protein D3C81_07670 [compost metagenome]
MKLLELVNNIDKSSQNESYIDTTNFSIDLEHDFDYVSQDRLKGYWVGNWCCTDTWVGYRLYFLDDEPVCFSVQNGRKSEEVFNWFSNGLALKVRDYLISIMPKRKDEFSVQTCSLEDDIGDSYKISFSSQVLDWGKATLNGESIKVLERVRKKPDFGIDTELKVELNNGEQKIIDLKELDFKFNLKS